MTFFAGASNVTFNVGPNGGPTFRVIEGNHYIQEYHCSSSVQSERRTHTRTTHVESSRRPIPIRSQRRENRARESQGRTLRDETPSLPYTQRQGWSHNGNVSTYYDAANNNTVHEISSSAPNSGPNHHYSSNIAEMTWGQHGSRRSSPDVSPRNRYPNHYDARESYHSQARRIPRDQVSRRFNSPSEGRTPHNSPVNDSNVQIMLNGSDVHYRYSQIDRRTGQQTFHSVVIPDDARHIPEPYPAPWEVPNDPEILSCAPAPSYQESCEDIRVDGQVPSYTREDAAPIPSYQNIARQAAHF
ncbi:hypothetical protein BDP27DRAFT_1329565 [Rhodocollybia butyracea]|uniref:Uncharacterized protein n=1 Tax=Rhodocollybia butyracea TaxID=206335 RepID=A0A9P5U6M2_9AGAR|nr:hypothetical protein BDP27DRAFT_1329565 [Rhodocollybia butyracea]